MEAAFDPIWKSYALTGRPDFLNYLRRGDVTWGELWRFYRENPADPAAMVRLMGLFHLFLSQDYDREGCVLDPDGRVYPELREWAGFAVAAQEFVPEEKLRDSLAGFLSQSLISPLYYEAVFSVYVEACLEEHAQAGNFSPTPLTVFGEKVSADTGGRRLAMRLPELPRYPGEALSSLLDRHYDSWNLAYVAALGED